MTSTDQQRDFIQRAIHHCADEASDALRRWIGRPARITFDGLERLPLAEATSVLGSSEEPICFCIADLTGRFTGHLVLAFDDASGLALADMLLGQERGTATEWSDLETSAALETTNIVCCAYLNALVRMMPTIPGEPEELLPTPPRFSRDYAESLLEFTLMDQIIASDVVLLARTEFHIDGAPVDWTLLFVPDAGALAKLDVNST